MDEGFCEESLSDLPQSEAEVEMREIARSRHKDLLCRMANSGCQLQPSAALTLLMLISIPLVQGFACGNTAMASPFFQRVSTSRLAQACTLGTETALPGRRPRGSLLRMQEEGGKKEGADKLQQLVAKYGRVALLSHVAIQGLAFAVVYPLVQSAGDIGQLTRQLPEFLSARIDPTAGALAVTFILVKATMPARLLMDAAITPKLADVLSNTPLAGPLGLKTV